MIVTVTTNAALDRTLTVPVFQIGFRHRSSDVLTLAGGKGINVARALKILEVPVVATGLAGGRTGTRIIEELTSEAILNDFVRISAESRNVDRRRRPDRRHPHGDQRVGARGDARSSSRCSRRSSTTSRAAPTSSSSSGSLPRKVATTFYADAVRDLARRDVRVVLDSEGEPLRLAVEAGPFLVSPNQREAEQLVGQELEDDDDFLMALDAIAEMGAAQRPHHARERMLRAPAHRTEDAADPRIRAARGARCPVSARATCSSRSSSPRSATSGRPTTRSGPRLPRVQPRCARSGRVASIPPRRDARGGHRALRAPARPLVDSLHARAAQGGHGAVLRPRRLDGSRRVGGPRGGARAHAPLLRGSARDPRASRRHSGEVRRRCGDGRLRDPDGARGRRASCRARGLGDARGDRRARAGGTDRDQHGRGRRGRRGRDARHRRRGQRRRAARAERPRRRSSHRGRDATSRPRCGRRRAARASGAEGKVRAGRRISARRRRR